MDAFKILSRSTHLSRKPSSSAQSIPQPAISTLLEHDHDGDPSILAKEPSLKKRKLSSVEHESSMPQELDYFDAVLEPRQNHETPVKTGSTKRMHKDSNVEVDQSNSELNDLPENDCRRILKEHKLKITQLDRHGPKIEAYINAKRTMRRKTDETASTAYRSPPAKKQRLDVIIQPLLSFSQLRSRYHIDAQLAANLQEQGYVMPTEVQMAALPLLLDSFEYRGNISSMQEAENRINIDLLSVAPTGSGKTLAFLIPVLDSVARQISGDALQDSQLGPNAVIMAPTKELAVQIVHETRKLARGMDIRCSIAKKSMTFGVKDDVAESNDQINSDDWSATDNGTSKKDKQKHNLFPHVLISTPLTLVNMMTDEEGAFKDMSTVQYLILDEADVLLDPVFRLQTLKIWSNCTHPGLRVSLWSATMGASVEDQARSTILDRLEAHSRPAPPAPLLRLVVGLKDSAIPHIHHRLTYCGTEAGKLLAMRQLLCPTSSAASAADMPLLRPPFLVFTQTIPRAKALHSELLYDIPPSAGGSSRIAVLHADLTSSARASIMSRVRRGEVWVLITTDLLSRGVDFKGINGVVNYDFPNSSAAYVHRVGRTGRAGRGGGVAVTLYAKEDVPFVKNVANVIAATQRMKQRGPGDQDGMGEAGGLAPWLLNALPKPSKRDRQRLKKRGIEERRPDRARTEAQTRISTKSGFEKRIEGRRRRAVEESKRKRARESASKDRTDDAAFEGFD